MGQEAAPSKRLLVQMGKSDSTQEAFSPTPCFLPLQPCRFCAFWPRPSWSLPLLPFRCAALLFGLDWWSFRFSPLPFCARPGGVESVAPTASGRPLQAGTRLHLLRVLVRFFCALAVVVLIPLSALRIAPSPGTTSTSSVRFWGLLDQRNPDTEPLVMRGGCG